MSTPLKTYSTLNPVDFKLSTNLRNTYQIDQSNPTTNYGTSTQVRVDGSPLVWSYLRFDVQGLSGTVVTSATLRIYANSASSTGYTLYGVSDNTWTETGITYSNAPTMGSQLGSSGVITAGTWTTVDVTSYITGNGSYNFGFSTTSNTRLRASASPAAKEPTRRGVIAQFMVYWI
jgi:hypothetical protein